MVRNVTGHLFEFEDRRCNNVNVGPVFGEHVDEELPVKPALSDAEYLRVSSLARTDWWPLIRQAIRVWETADHTSPMTRRTAERCFHRTGHESAPNALATSLRAPSPRQCSTSATGGTFRSTESQTT